MPVELNHTIVHAADREATAAFFAEILGLSPASSYGPFLVVDVANGVSLDVMADDGEISGQHYAFLVTEAEFDEIHGRIVERGIPYWADPHHDIPQQVNTNDGGRGLYWDDPNGHVLEIITRPYGG